MPVETWVANAAASLQALLERWVGCGQQQQQKQGQQTLQRGDHCLPLVPCRGAGDCPCPPSMPAWLPQPMPKGIVLLVLLFFLRHSLVGLDINYEEGLDGPAGDSFAPAMAALMARLMAWRPQLLVSVAPFDATWAQYKQLLQVRWVQPDNWLLM